jgi:proline iminopeptidase
MAGEQVPMTPVPFGQTIADRLPPHLVRFQRFADCGHGVVCDQPARHFQVLRDFLLD